MPHLTRRSRVGLNTGIKSHTGQFSNEHLELEDNGNISSMQLDKCLQLDFLHSHIYIYMAFSCWSEHNLDFLNLVWIWILRWITRIWILRWIRRIWILRWIRSSRQIESKRSQCSGCRHCNGFAQFARLKHTEHIETL